MFKQSQERKNIEEQNQIKFIKKIGQGAFGKVYEALDLKDGIRVAIKVPRKVFKFEQYIMQCLEHPNIVPFKKLLQGIKSIYIVMQLMEGESLRSMINKRKQDRILNEEEVCLVMRQILQAVDYMHDKQIIHRDLKTENILLEKKDDLESIKIVDFGLSLQFQEDNSNYKQVSGRCGTFYFMSPEQLNNQQYGKPVDMWSCGIIMYLLITTGKHPFSKQGETRDHYVKNLNSNTFQSQGISQQAIDLLNRLLAYKAIERYSAGQALNHPWITRKLLDSIPLTIDENRQLFKANFKFTEIIKLLIVLQKMKIIAQERKQVQILQLIIPPTPLLLPFNLVLHSIEQDEIIEKPQSPKHPPRMKSQSYTTGFQLRVRKMVTSPQMFELKKYDKSASPNFNKTNHQRFVTHRLHSDVQPTSFLSSYQDFSPQTSPKQQLKKINAIHIQQKQLPPLRNQTRKSNF